MHVASPAVCTMKTSESGVIEALDGSAVVPPLVQPDVADAVALELSALSARVGSATDGDVESASDGGIHQDLHPAPRLAALVEALLCAVLGTFSGWVIAGLSGLPLLGVGCGAALAALGWAWRTRPPIRGDFDGF